MGDPKMVTPDLTELERLNRQAIPKTWTVITEGFVTTVYGADGGMEVATVTRRCDARLIAAMRNALPSLLQALTTANARIAELEAENAQLKHEGEVLGALYVGDAPPKDAARALVERAQAAERTRDEWKAKYYDLADAVARESTSHDDLCNQARETRRARDEALRRAEAAEDVIGSVWMALDLGTSVREALMVDHAPDFWACPKCGRNAVNSEVGVVSHLGAYGCGYCSHPARANGVCEICGDATIDPKVKP